MNARPILIALVAATALVLFCLRFVVGPTSDGPTSDGAEVASASLGGEAAARDPETIVGGAVREQRVGVTEEEGDAPRPRAEVSTDAEQATPDEEAARRAETVLQGVCIDSATKAPVAGVAVLSGEHATSSGAAGVFTMPWPSRADTAFLIVQHAGFVEQRVPVQRAAAGSDGLEPDDAVVRVEVHLRRGLPLALEVVDSVTGSPVAGATLLGESREHPCAVSDERGRASLHVLAGASFECSVGAEGYAEVRWTWRVDESAADGRVVLPLVPAAWLAGKVVDDAGRGIAGAAIVAFQPQIRTREYGAGVGERWGDVLVPGELRFRLGSYGRGHAEADAAGAFRMTVPPSTTPFTLVASRRGYVDSAVEGVLVDASGRHGEVELVLAHGASIEGRVVRNGEPWNGALRWSRADGVEQGTLVRDGRYRIRDLAPGTLRLAIVSELTQAVACEELVDVAPGAELVQDMAWSEPFATIAGRVARADGEPAGDVVVGARLDADGEQTRFWTRSAADGAFVLEVPPEGTFDVSAYDRVTRVWARGIPAGAEEVALVLAEGGTLELVLVDAATQSPVTTDERRFLSWSESGDLRSHRVASRLAGDGTTTLTLPAGRIDLTVDLTQLGYARKTLSHVLVQPRGDRLRVELERGVDVRFRLDGRSARRLRRHAVFLLEETQRDLVRGPFEGKTDESNTRINGRRLWVDGSVARQQVDLGRRNNAALQGLAPGRYVLRCFPDDVRLEPSTIDLTKPGITEVGLVLER